MDANLLSYIGGREPMSRGVSYRKRIVKVTAHAYFFGRWVRILVVFRDEPKVIMHNLRDIAELFSSCIFTIFFNLEGIPQRNVTPQMDHLCWLYLLIDEYLLHLIIYVLCFLLLSRIIVLIRRVESFSNLLKLLAV